MLKEPLRILGINPGTRYLALAIFQDWSLLDWRICNFEGKWSIKKMNRILEYISGQIDLHDINTIALKKIHPSHSSSQLGTLSSRIKILARKKRITVFQQSIKELEGCLLPEGRQNKMVLAEKIINDYPWLNSEWSKEKLHKSPYRLRSIEAVGTAIACFRQNQA